MEMQSNKKPIFKKWWFWAIIIFVVIVIGATKNQDGNTATTANASESNTSKKEASKSVTEVPKKEAEITKEVKAEVKSETPKADFSKMDITVANIKTAIKDVVETDKLKDVQVTNEKGKTIIDVYFDPGTVWDEKDLVHQTAMKATDTMVVLFKNPKVDKIWFWTTTKMTDAKGNEKDQEVVNVCLTKENAKDINWSKFKDMVLLDYKNLFNIADSSFIYPSIKSKLE